MLPRSERLKKNKVDLLPGRLFPAALFYAKFENKADKNMRHIVFKPHLCLLPQKTVNSEGRRKCKVKG